MPRERQKADYDDDLKGELRSEVRVSGIPKPEMHSARAAIQVSAEVSWMG